jgi:hypothetical protein
VADSLGVKPARRVPSVATATATRSAVEPGARTAEGGTSRSRRRPSWRKVNWLVGAIALPGLAAYAIAIIYPIIDTLYTSLFNWNIISGVHKYVGLTARSARPLRTRRRGP